MDRYRLTPRAEADRNRIVSDGLREWGKCRVEEYLDDLEACFERLALFPNMGEACEQIREGYRCFPIEAHHIYYRLDDPGVVIVRIWPQRMAVRGDTLDEGSAEK